MHKPRERRTAGRWPLLLIAPLAIGILAIAPRSFAQAAGQPAPAPAPAKTPQPFFPMTPSGQIDAAIARGEKPPVQPGQSEAEAAAAAAAAGDKPAQEPPLVVSPANAREVPLEGVPSSTAARVGGAATPEGAEALPVGAAEGPKVTLAFADAAIEQVIDKIRKDTGVVVRAKGKTAGSRLSLRIREMPIEDALDNIAKPNNWKWVKRTDGSYDLYDQDTYISDVLSQRVQRKVFPLKYIDAVELNKVIEPVLSPEVGASSSDERTNSLIVTDLPDKLAMIESIVREYDIQLYTHVFELANADTDDIADRLNQIKSKYSEIQVDPKNHTIIVKDETLEKIKVMEQIVEILDRDQEIRIYHLNVIGADGKDAQDLIKAFIEPVVTKDATLEFNATTGLLYVRDVRSVHKKILEILKQVDRPRKQVLIEGELVSAVLTNSLSVGMNWNFGNSLLDAINTNKVDSAGFPGVNPGDPASTQLKGFPLGSIAAGTGLSVTAMTNSVRAQLNAVLSDSRTRLLLKPRLILENHKEGSLKDTRDEPILSTFINDSTNTSGFRTSSQTFVESGLSIDITPAISDRGLVELDIEFENSVPIIVPDIGGGQRGVGKSQQNAQTTLIVPSGETRVLGGLISRDFSNGNAGVPFLSQIPYLGFLFGTKSNDTTLRNLMFFITPTILETQPTNDLIVEPVNAPAKASMLEETEATAAPEDVNEIPAELKPYLDQIRPASVPYESKDSATSGTMIDFGATTATLKNEPTSGTLSLKSGAASARALLTDDPINKKLDAGSTDIVKVGGAADQAKPGRSGPSGAFGGVVRPPAPPRPAPGRTPPGVNIPPNPNQPVPNQPAPNQPAPNQPAPGTNPNGVPGPPVPVIGPPVPGVPPTDTRFGAVQ